MNQLDRDLIELVIRNFWEQLLKEPSAALDRYCTPDVSLRILTDSGSNWIDAEGPESVLSAIHGINTCLEFLSFEIDTVIIDYPRAAVRWHAAFRHRATSAVGEICFFDHVVFVGSQICHYTVFMDTDSFRNLLAGKPQPMLSRKAHKTAANACRGLSKTASLSLSEREAREAFLREFWDDRVRRGSVAMQERMTEDTELCLLGDPVAIPFARHLSGITAVQQLAKQVDIEFEILDREVLQVTIEGDQAAVQWFAELRHRGTSARGSIESFDHVIFRDGRIASTTRFFDTAGMVRWIQG